MAIPESVLTAVIEGRLDDAESELRSHLNSNPDAWEAQLELARVHLAQYRYDDAEKQFSSLLEHEDARGDALGIRGLWNVMLDRTEDAEADYRASLEVLPEQTSVLFNLGRLLTYKEDLSESGAEEAESLLKKAIELEPDHFQAEYELAGLYTRLGRVEDAALACRRVLEINPLFIRAYIFLGTIFVQVGKVDEVINLYKAALLNNPLAHIFRDELIRLYQLQGKLEEAYQIAVAQSNMRGVYEDFLNVGNLALQLDQPAVAEVAFVKAEQVSPEGWRAPYNLGELYRGAQQYENAVDAFQRSLSNTPTGFAHTGLGLVYFEQEGDEALNNAIEHFRQAIHIGPSEGYVVLNLAYALRKADREDEINAFLEQLDQLLGNDDPAYEEIKNLLAA